MIISFLEETIAAAIIGFIVERIIRKTLKYIYKEENTDNIHLEYHPQNTVDELVIVAEKDNNTKLYKFSKYI